MVVLTTIVPGTYVVVVRSSLLYEYYCTFKLTKLTVIILFILMIYCSSSEPTHNQNKRLIRIKRSIKNSNYTLVSKQQQYKDLTRQSTNFEKMSSDNKKIDSKDTEKE